MGQYDTRSKQSSWPAPARATPYSALPADNPLPDPLPGQGEGISKSAVQLRIAATPFVASSSEHRRGGFSRSPPIQSKPFSDPLSPVRETVQSSLFSVSLSLVRERGFQSPRYNSVSPQLLSLPPVSEHRQRWILAITTANSKQAIF